MKTKIELKVSGLDETAQIWLTDEAALARQLAADRKCVIFILTEKNRQESLAEIRYCVELLPEETVSFQEQVTEEYLERVWRRHMGLPWHILETKRLLLREMTIDDADNLIKMYKDEEMTRFMEPLGAEQEDLTELIAAYIRGMYEFYEFGIWIVELEDGTVIGRAGLQLREGEEYPELGFCIDADYRNCGYAYEACRAVLRYGFEELEFPVIRVVVHKDNHKSLKLCKKLGFSVESGRISEDGLWISMEMSSDREK